MEIQRRREVKLKNILAYGVGDLYGGGSFFIIGALLMLFLTDVAGLTPIQAGAVVAVGKVWDAVTDPVMGYISDHTKSRFGRRRRYFLLGIIPIYISFVLLWMPAKFGASYNFLYYILAYMLFSTVFTMVMVPYNTLGAEMTSDYRVRTKMTGVRMFFSQFSVLLGGFFPKKIIDSFPQDKQYMGYLVMALIFGIVFALPWILVYLGTWEKDESDKNYSKESFAKEMKKIFKDFGSVFVNKSFRIHVSMYLFAYLAMDVFNALMLYFITYYLHKEGLYSNTLAVMVLTQVVSLAAVTYGCMKKGNAFTYRVHMVVWAAAIFLFGTFTPGTQVIKFYLAAAAIGFGLSGAVMVPYNILPFISDVDQMITARRREGIYAGLMTFIRKMAQAGALFLVGVGLDSIGYKANQAQTAQTLAGLRTMIVYIPIVLISMGILISIWFKINPDNHKILIDEIERLKSGGEKSKVTAKAREVCEVLTGRKYDNLWM